MGTGSSKAELSKPFVKYMKKLTNNIGHVDNAGVTIKSVMSEILIHFSKFWLIPVYNACDFEYFSPEQIHKMSLT